MLIREHFEVKETAVTIVADRRYVGIAKDAIFNARSIIERKIAQDPFFGTTFDPYPACKDDDALIQRMCSVSVRTGVGPMAAVAGAVASYSVETMMGRGARYAVVENGGDIAMINDIPVTVGMYSGDPDLEGISLLMEPSEHIRGVCSSSGRIGPSVSFGNSDICTVFSDDVILADAAATRLGNLLKGDIAEALETVGSIEGIEGCFASVDGKVAMFGNIPELIRAVVPKDRAATIRFS